MTMQDLRDGLGELAAPVTRGVVFDDLARQVSRSRRRRASVAGSALVLALTASGYAVLRPNAPVPAHLSEAGPITVTVPEMQWRVLSRTIGDQRQGVRLSTYPVGDDALITVGLRGNGWTCITGYLESGVTGMGAGGSCGMGTHATEPGPDEVIYPGLSMGTAGGKPYVVLEGAGPRGTTRIVLTASNGQTLDVPVYDAGESWGHKAYFAVPWVTGTTVIKAYDASGTALACGTAAKGSRCTTPP